MASSHSSEVGLGSRRSGSSSSRKRNKSNSEKPKQPQRGIGVAQLEKIRLQSQMATSYLPSFQPPCLPSINKEEDVRLRMNYLPSPPSSVVAAPTSPLLRLQYNTQIFQPHHFAQPATTLPLLDQNMEDFDEKNRPHDRHHFTGSFSQNSDGRDSQGLDLDLKLSL